MSELPDDRVRYGSVKSREVKSFPCSRLSRRSYYVTSNLLEIDSVQQGERIVHLLKQYIPNT